MKQENRDFLDANRDSYDQVMNVQVATKAKKIETELLNIMVTEFDPVFGELYVGGCGDCLFNLTRLVYQRYDKWKEAQPIKLTVDIPLIVSATFPINEPPEESKEEVKYTLTVDVKPVETPEEKKARLADPNRIIKPRKKRNG